MSVVKCFMCGVDTDSQTTHTIIPKELLDRDNDGNFVERYEPHCLKCLYFKRNIDINFIELCKSARMFEWYRCSSRKKNEYYPSTLVYNLELEKIRELYWHVLDACIAADKVASDDNNRRSNEENFNYDWRKRDV